VRISNPKCPFGLGCSYRKTKELDRNVHVKQKIGNHKKFIMNERFVEYPILVHY
jgi:hypothetical protein